MPNYKPHLYKNLMPYKRHIIKLEWALKNSVGISKIIKVKKI